MDRHGADQDQFAWPDGFRAAVALTFDVDAEAVVLNVNQAYGRRPSIMTHQQYGPVTGVPRLLRILADRGVRATFFIPGFTAERHPDMVAAVQSAGHEIGHHGYLHEQLKGVGEPEERAFMERGLEALQRVAGVRPSGYRAPWWDTTDRTLDLVAEYGFSYDSSLFDRDVPYRVATASVPIVEICVSWALDDWEKYAFLPDPPMGSGVIERPSAVLETWWEEIQAYEQVGGCCVLTMHPFLSGRPARARALAELVDRIKARPAIWLTTLGEIAAHAARVGGPAQPLSLPAPSSGPKSSVPVGAAREDRS